MGLNLNGCQFVCLFVFLSRYSYMSTGMKCVNHKSKTYNRYTNVRNKRIQGYHCSKSSNGIKNKKVKKKEQ